MEWSLPFCILQWQQIPKNFHKHTAFLKEKCSEYLTLIYSSRGRLVTGYDDVLHSNSDKFI